MVELLLEIITEGMYRKSHEILNHFFYAVVLEKRFWMLVGKLL